MGSSPIRVARNASVAQLVEQRTENPRVVGSIPTGGPIADLAHLVERDLAKVEVAGSSPVIRSNKKGTPPQSWGCSFFAAASYGCEEPSWIFTEIHGGASFAAGKTQLFAARRK